MTDRMSKSAPQPRRGRSRHRGRGGRSRSSSSNKSRNEEPIPGPSSAGNLSRPLRRDAGGRLVSATDPQGSSTSAKDKGQETNSQVLASKPPGLPSTGRSSIPTGPPAVGLDNPSMRAPNPDMAAGVDSTNNGVDTYQWLTDALTPIKTVAQLREVIREELVGRCIAKEEAIAIARQIAKEEVEASQELTIALMKTSPLSKENCDLVIDQLMPHFRQENTKVINYYLDKYQWDESELDRLARKLVPLLHTRVQEVQVVPPSRMAQEAQASYTPSRQYAFERDHDRTHEAEDDRYEKHRYSRWERDIVSERRHRDIQSHGQVPLPEERRTHPGSGAQFLLGPGIEDMGPYEPHLKERVPRNRAFKNVLSYRAYRLKDLDQKFTAAQGDHLADYQKRFKGVFQGKPFSGEEEIEVLRFLTNYKEACNDSTLSEAVALRLFRFNLKGMALASFETYLSRNRRGGVRGEDCIESYCDAVQWFLNTFATDEILSEAYRKVNQMRQNPNETEEQFGNRLREEALRCGNIFDDGNLTQMFIDGLSDSVRPLMIRAAGKDPTASLMAMQREAKSIGDSQRAGRIRAGSPSRRTSALAVDSLPRPVETGNPMSQIFAIEPVSGISTPSSSPGRFSLLNSTTTSGSNKNSPQQPRVRPRSPTKYNRVLICYGCYEEGHIFIDCPLLDPRTRKVFLEAQQKKQAARRMESGSQGQISPSQVPSVPRADSPVRKINFDESSAQRNSGPAIPKTILKK